MLSPFLSTRSALLDEYNKVDYLKLKARRDQQVQGKQRPSHNSHPPSFHVEVFGSRFIARSSGVVVQ